MDMDNLIPIDTVLEDMMSDDGLVASGAKDYYSRYYGDEEKQKGILNADSVYKQTMGVGLNGILFNMPMLFTAGKGNYSRRNNLSLLSRPRILIKADLRFRYSRSVRGRVIGTKPNCANNLPQMIKSRLLTS